MERIETWRMTYGVQHTWEGPGGLILVEEIWDDPKCPRHLRIVWPWMRSQGRAGKWLYSKQYAK